MDANGTRFHLLLSREDWLAGGTESGAVDWVEGRGELTLRARILDFGSPPGDRPPALADRRGAAADAYGNRYWIDAPGTGVLVESAGSRRTSRYWAPGFGASCPPAGRYGDFEEQPAAPGAGPGWPELPLAGLAVTDDGRLVAGVTRPAGLLVFDLRSAGPPARVEWPARVAFEPFDMAARRGGGVLVLDRANGRQWELDRHLRVIALDDAVPLDAPVPGGFEPLEPGAGPQPVEGAVHGDDSAPVDGDPIAVEGAPDGSVLVLDRGTGVSSVLRYEHGRPAGSIELSDFDVAVTVAAHDIALVPAIDTTEHDGRRRLGRMFAASVSGNQAYAFDLWVEGGGLHAALVRAYLPMRSFGGKGLIADASRALYDFGDGWVPVVEQRRPRYVEEAVLLSPVLDSREPGCTWHRVMIDGCLPPETGVEVWSRAGEEEDDVLAAAWRPEPTPVRRGDGSELPFLPPPPSDAYGTWELLLQDARARRLQLRLRLWGDGRTSPRLRALRVYYPRFSYLERYLPKAYRREPKSASFLERFLANLEGLATPFEDRIAAAQLLLDPRTAPAGALDWLAGWFDVALDPAWDERRSRVFVEHAMELLRWRGTIRGLELALRLALDPQADATLFAEPDLEGPRRARVVERFRARAAPAVVAGDPTDATGPRVTRWSARWVPAQGAESLNARWSAQIGESDPAGAFPMADPGGELSQPWRAFALDVLGFVPSGGADVDAWRDFLRHRYLRSDALPAAYGAGADLSSLPYPALLPPDGAPLVDWYQFESVVLPTRRAAHRFTVLLPVPPGNDERMDGRTPDERRGIAERVVELQKPAHTRFEIRFFWAAFRLGESRLGHDTLIDLGSRSPNLMREAVLGRDHVGESYLGGDPAPVAGPTALRDRTRTIE